MYVPRNKNAEGNRRNNELLSLKVYATIKGRETKQNIKVRDETVK